jgi:hypothetical protein
MESGAKSKSGLAREAEYTVKINRDWMGCLGWKFGSGNVDPEFLRSKYCFTRKIR